MSETESASLWKEIGKQQGRLDGHDQRLDQQHQDTLRLTDKVDQLSRDTAAGFKESNATMLACFGDLENRLIAAFTAQLAAAQNGSIDFGALLKKPYVAAPVGGGIGAIILLLAQYLQQHT